MKKRLILHVGTGKTGTTSLQKHLALNRSTLSAAGVLYPDLSSIVGGQRFYHNGLANRGIGAKTADPTVFVALNLLANESSHDRILLSAEALGVRGDPGPASASYESRRRAFVKRLGKQLNAFDVHPVIVLRRQDTFVESGYKQMVKHGPSRATARAKLGDFAAYRQNSLGRANYDLQVSLLRKYLGEPTVLRYEDGNVIDTFCESLGLDAPVRRESAANVSAPASLAAWMRAVPVGEVKEREAFTLGQADRYSEPGSRTLWESQDARDAFLEHFADHTYGGHFFPPPRPIAPAMPLAPADIASLTIEFAELRRERAVANRAAKYLS